MNELSPLRNEKLYPYCVIDNKLFKTYEYNVCACCGAKPKKVNGKPFVNAHHLVKQQILRLDCVELMVPLCWDCHRGEHFPDEFIKMWDIEKYNRFFVVSLEYVEKIINKYVKNKKAVLRRDYDNAIKKDDKKKVKIPSKPMPFGKGSKYKKCMDGSIKLREG